MEEKQTSLSMHALYYGAGTGLALIVFTMILYISDLYLNQTLGYLGFLILIAGMAIGSFQYKKVQLKGYMTYGQAFSANFLIGLYASLISVVFFYFYVTYINNGMIEELLSQVRAKMEAKSGTMTPEQMDQAMGMTSKFMTPVWMTIWGFLGYIFWSAIFSLIIGIFLKKNNPDNTVQA